MDLFRTTGLLILGVSIGVFPVKASLKNENGKRGRVTVVLDPLKGNGRSKERKGVSFIDANKAKRLKADSLKSDSNLVQQLYSVTSGRLAVTSTGSLAGSAIEKIPVTHFANALTGQLSGLYTLQSSGAPGSSTASVSLRGQIPILLIDGVVSTISSLDLEEIASVTVLKDAAATAMLGVRGSHGAVLVTTKRGNVGKQQISATVQSAIQQPLNWLKPLNAYNYGLLKNEALRNDGVDANSGLYFSPAALAAFRDQTDPINYPDVNYRKAITKDNSPFNRYTVSSKGGSNFARYFVSLDHVNQQGLLISPDSIEQYSTSNYFKSYVVRTNLDLNPTKKLSVGLSIFGRIQNYNEPGAGVTSVLSNMINTPANSYPLLNTNNSFAGNQLYQNNVLAQVVGGGYRQLFYRDILSSMYLRRTLDDVVKGMWIKFNVAYSSGLVELITRNRSFAVFQATPTGYTQYGNISALANGNGVIAQNRMNYQEIDLGYDRSFGKHQFNALFLVNRDNTTNPFDPSELPYTIVGTSGKLAYNFDGKYIAEASFGLNGSNRYPADGNTKYGFFPAVALGWNIHKEEFFKNISSFNRLKLYTSYGVSGWDNPGYFAYYQRYNDSASPYFGTGAGTVTAITEGTLANQNILIEKANKFNAGINGALFNNKLSFNAEYFNNTFYDLAIQRGANSTLLGNNYPDEYLGKARYFGWEGQLGWQQKVKKAAYFVNLNVSTIGSEILNMNEVNYPYSWMQRTGKPVDQQFGYVAEGLFQSQDEINNSAKIIGYTPQPGDIKYKDLNSDGRIDQYDVTAIGKTKPRFFYGISLGFSVKRFDVSALLQGVENRNINFNSATNYWAFQNSGIGQAYEHHLNRWTPENAANAAYPRLSYGANVNNDVVSSYWTRNGDYLRLKSAEIGYSLPEGLIRKVHLSTVRVFANGYNLFTVASSGLDGRDPESYYGDYPLQRVINLGLNIKF